MAQTTENIRDLMNMIDELQRQNWELQRQNRELRETISNMEEDKKTMIKQLCWCNGLDNFGDKQDE